MKIARLVGLMLVAVMAVSLAVASSAFAEPEFKPVGGTFTGTSGTSKLVAGSNSITCTTDTSKGTISSATLAGGVTVDFSGCKSTGSGGSNCTVKSTNTSNAGLILTNTLHGILGLSLTSGASTGVALLLLPSAAGSKEFVKIESNKCTTTTTAVEGSVAGAVTPVGKSQITGKLTFLPGTEGESIKTFDPSTGGKVSPELEAFGIEASEETTEALTFSAALEVT